MGLLMPYLLIILLLAATATILLLILMQRNRTLQRLQQREKMRTGFFRGLVHEFRTPLNIIQGLSRHLREVNQTGNNSHSYLGAIERQGKILNNLANRLQEATGFETSDAPDAWKRGNIVAFLEMVAESFLLITRKKGVELVFFSEETQIETDFHPSHLQQILLLLLNKALESSHEGSRIFLIVERQRRDRKRFTIKVVDHGSGFSKK
jgi:signal transduction histidine kinase